MLYTSTNLLVGVSSLLARPLAWMSGAGRFRFAGKTPTNEFARYREPRRLTLAEQWGYLTDTIKGALSQAEEATRCHASAALQLDLAQYALSSLVDELSAVMDVGGRRRPATVLMFDIQPPSSPRPLNNAIAA